ncbi:MAG TPA: DNA primase, partial [Thermomonas sp.]|nr:DNA primase [Thermomonas sp.]
GAFGDLMQQRLTTLTGIGARSGSTPQPPPRMQRHAPANPSQKPSLIRSAITHLLHRPALALELVPPYRFAALQQPGIELLSELVLLVRERPDITTGLLLEHFAERENAAALHKLAVLVLPGEEADLRTEFLDAIAQLDKQVLQQRIEALQQRYAELDGTEKRELLALLQTRLQR